jgi:hypothetical protein
MGRWFGATRPSSAAEAERLYNVADFGNDLTTVRQYVIPKGTVVSEGRVAGGTGYQYYVADPLQSGVKSVGPAVPLPQTGF